MTTKSILVLLCFFIFAEAEHTHFVIVIPSYNNAAWYEKNLISAINQEYPQEYFDIIYVNDCSTDNTGQLVERFIQEHQIKNITLINNPKNFGALANITSVVHTLWDNYVVVLLDGDDWFYSTKVLQILDQTYQKGATWLTYGSFTSSRGGKKRGNEIPSEILQANGIRHYKWVSSHLRTFYAGLYKKINIDDLKFQGLFYRMAWDLAIMYPMIEMAAERATFIGQLLYVYNYGNPISDFRKNIKLQCFYEKNIRTKQPYNRLEKLFE